MNEHNFPLFVLILSIVLLVSAISRMLFISRTKKTTGTITAIDTDSRGGSTSILVTVEYTTEKGRFYQYTYEFQQAFLKRVGDRIDVYYDPKKPNEDVLVGHPLVSLELVFEALAVAIVIYILFRLK